MGHSPHGKTTQGREFCPSICPGAHSSGIHQPKHSDVSHSRMSGCRDQPFSSGLEAASSHWAVELKHSCFSGISILRWRVGGKCFLLWHPGWHGTWPCFGAGQLPAESASALLACPGPRLLLLSFCCRSNSRNHYKDSPTSNSGQEWPGELFPGSLLAGAQKNKVT